MNLWVIKSSSCFYYTDSYGELILREWGDKGEACPSVSSSFTFRGNNQSAAEAALIRV